VSDGNLEQVIRRVDRLERELRWWKAGARLMVVLAAALLLMGQYPLGPPKNIEAERFTLLDKEGKIRAEWAVYQGLAVINFYDDQTKVFWKAP
jgi:hypothetical protein